MRILFGIDVLQRDQFALLKNKKFGLLTNLSAVNTRLQTTYRLCVEQDAGKLTAIFTPEHGFGGAAPDGVVVASGTDARTGVPIHSLYATHYRATPEMLKDVEVVVCDIQDIGVRYYTYLWTVSLMLEEAGKHHIPVIVLDRPNPLGKFVCGLPVYPEMESLVGRYNIPVCHGMTMGELVLMFNDRWNPNPAQLQVIPCEGWQRTQRWNDSGLPWIPTSPAMPHFSTVQHYPGACLVEGTNLSEGRGTSLPFEIIGAPWIEGFALADHLNEQQWAGVRFRVHHFRPTASKYAGEDCAGVQAHITDGRVFHPFHVWLAVLREVRNLYPDYFAWIEPPAGYEPHIDYLAGSCHLRQLMDDGAALAEILADEQSFCDSFITVAESYRLYD